MDPLTDKEYWENVWNRVDIPPPSFPEVSSLRNHGKNEFHRFFSKNLNRITPPSSIIEFGCAQSTWLPYFARIYKLNVAGLDYSPLGCERAKAILKREKINGEIFNRDLFNFPLKGEKKYDVAVSFGVIEHFADPCIPLKAMAAYVNPGGLIFTIVPNMTGIVGSLQRILNRSVFDNHQRIDATDLDILHINAGLKPISIEYLLPLGLTVVNLGDKPSIYKKILLFFCKLITVQIWLLDRLMFRSLPRTKALSPYVVCAAIVSHKYN